MAPSSRDTPPNESIQWLQFSDLWVLTVGSGGWGRRTNTFAVDGARMKCVDMNSW